MLFDYKEPIHNPSFWMRRCVVPLDMLFLDSNMIVRGISRNVQPPAAVEDIPKETIQHQGTYRYVLELHGGEARGIKEGDKLSLQSAQ